MDRERTFRCLGQIQCVTLFDPEGLKGFFGQNDPERIPDFADFGFDWHGITLVITFSLSNDFWLIFMQRSLFKNRNRQVIARTTARLANEATVLTAMVPAASASSPFIWLAIV